MIKIDRRSNWTLPILTILGAFGVAVIMILFIAPRPGTTLGAFFLQPLKNRFALGNMVAEASLLTLTGLGVAAAFRAGLFNLGGEGQVLAGGLGALGFARLLPGVPYPLAPIAALTAGTVAGALIGGFSGSLKLRLKIDELISTFLISAALIPLAGSLITGPWAASNSYLMTTEAAPAAYGLSKWLPPSKMGIAAVLAPAAALGFGLFLYKTLWGYEWRTTGRNREFAAYGGIPVERYTLWPMAVSGAFHGAAGALMLLGGSGAVTEGFSSNLGWNGIAVALIGANHPGAIVPAALIFSYLNQGAVQASLFGDLTWDTNALIQALVLMVITVRKWAPGRRS